VVDAEGNLHDAKDSQLWKQAQVSAFIRAQLYEPEMTLNGGCMVLADTLATPAAEQQLLSAVEHLYQRSVLPAALEPVSLAQGFGAVPEHMDLTLYSVLHHFRSRQRWAAARAFFSRLGAVYPAAAVWEAAAMKAAGEGAAVLELLGSALERSPTSPPLLAAMAAECMRLQQVMVYTRLGRGRGKGHKQLKAAVRAASVVHRSCIHQSPPPSSSTLSTQYTQTFQVDTAARLARRAVNMQRRCRPAWLILARCYASEGQFAEALVTLNAVPTPPLPRDERELLMVVPPPEPERITAVKSYQPDLEAARALALEEGDTSGTSRLLAYLPGAVLLNKEPADTAPWADASPNRVTRAVLGAVYSQLQEMVGVLGWVSVAGGVR